MFHTLFVLNLGAIKHFIIERFLVPEEKNGSKAEEWVDLTSCLTTMFKDGWLDVSDLQIGLERVLERVPTFERTSVLCAHLINVCFDVVRRGGVKIVDLEFIEATLREGKKLFKEVRDKVNLTEKCIGEEFIDLRFPETSPSSIDKIRSILEPATEV